MLFMSFQKRHKNVNVLQIFAMHEVQDKHLLGDQNFPSLMSVKYLGHGKTSEVPLCLTPCHEPLHMPSDASSSPWDEWTF